MSGGGFNDPLIGGGGALVYPSIHSPNFNVASPGASPNPSWAVLKSGLAYFFGLILSGGTITGPDYIINTAGFFLYSGPPALGNLAGSWTSAAGTDGFGNPYDAGLNIGFNSGTQIQLLNGVLSFLINQAGFSNPAIQGASGGTFVQLLLAGPASTVPGWADFIGVELNSSNGSSTSANMDFFYTDANGGSHAQAYLDYTGMQLRASLANGITPGTGTSNTNAAVAESWHSIPLSGWSTQTGGYVAQYRLNACGNVELRGRIVANTATQTISTALPAGYFPSPASGIPQWATSVAVIANTTVITVDQTPRIAISNAGILTVAGTTVAQNTQLSLDGCMFPQAS